MDTYEVRFETQAGEMVTEIVEASSYTRLEKTILFNVTGGPVVVPVAEYHIDSLLSIKKVEPVEKQKHDFGDFSDFPSRDPYGLWSWDVTTITRLDPMEGGIARRLRVKSGKYEVDYNIMPETLRRHGTD